jgi:hypothetical protein
MGNTEKIWWSSRGIWASLITMAIGVIGLIYKPIDISEAEINLLAGNIVDLLVQLANVAIILSGFFSWYGRWQATREISNNMIVPPKSTIPEMKGR